MKNLFLLGATGSIGKQTLEVIDHYHDEFRLLSIAIGKNIDEAIKIIKKYRPEFVSVIDKNDMEKLAYQFPRVKFGFGDEGLIEAATYSDEDGVLINAVVGMVGLIPTIKAIEKKRNVLLANKETLVVAGDIIKEKVKDNKVNLFPIDSEHSAILQCLLSGKKEDVSRIIITASGGSFRDFTRQQLENVTLEDALKHPNWSMGRKITIDSATMVNKGLEVIEAHYLFDIDYDYIDTIIHKESIIHSMVEYKDGSIIAQIAEPNMMVPIQYALTYPNRWENKDFKKIDVSKLSQISFNKMDMNRYPCLELAYFVGRVGGIMPTVYNASNEAAVILFLNKKIKFLDIEKIIFKAVSKASNMKNPTINDIINMDRRVKKEIFNEHEVNKCF